MSENDDNPEPQDPGPTDAEAAQAFVMWVEVMIHDLESVPDESTHQYWCREWWRHPEAVSRLSALYEAYGEAETDRALSAWWTQHWDSHARVLFSKVGPFKDCQREHRFLERKEEYTPRLFTTSPPPDWTP